MENSYLVSLVHQQILQDFKSLKMYELERLLNGIREDNRVISFIRYYNRTVLDKERFDFGEFKHQWAIQGMNKEVIDYFNSNYDNFKKEIIGEKNLNKFFIRYCCRVRKEASFCSKLFHTFLPDEFPPLDNPIKKLFHLQNEDFIKSVFIMKNGYRTFSKNQTEIIKSIRTLLLKPQYKYLRGNELSDFRILDMYYWLKNRE